MTPKPPRPGTIRAKIVELWNGGERDTAKIAAKIGRSRQQVNSALRQAGIENPRRRGERGPDRGKRRSMRKETT